MPGRITYNGITVDFVRNFQRADIIRANQRVELPAASGIKEILDFYEQDRWYIERDFLTEQEISELEEFFKYAKDGSTFQVELESDFGMYVDFEGKSVDTNDEATGTFVRSHTSATAYYVDKYTGLVTAGAEDTARFVAGKYGAGIPIEASRTNLITHPSSFDDASWTKTASISVTDNDTTEVLDPAGNNAADKIVTTDADQDIYFDTSTAISTDDAAFSVWLRVPSGSLATTTIAIDSTSAGVQESDTITVTSVWQKFKLTYESAGSVAGNWRARINLAGNGDTIYAYGAQFEVGSDIMNATTIISPLATAAATRNAETLQYVATNHIGKNAGTICFWFAPGWVFNQHPRADLFTSGVSDSNKHIYAQVLSNGNIQFLGYHLNDGTQAWSVAASASGVLTQDTFHRFCFTYDFTQDTGADIYVDGVNLNTSSEDASTASAIGTNFKLGSTIAGGAQANGVFSDLEIWKAKKDAQWVLRDYQLGRGRGYRRNRWTSARLVDKNFSPVQKVGKHYALALEFEEVLS